MADYFAIENKLSGNVIDIEGASNKSEALLDAFTQKTTDNDNQLWEFVLDPDGSGLYFMKSKLSGDVIDIKGASTAAGAALDVYPQTKNAKNQLWAFNPDPGGSGYFFIRSLLDGNVVDVQQNSTKAGALLDAYPQKTAGYDNQLWKVVNGAFPGPKYTSISWGPMGTGPAPNSPTTGSDGNECAYQAAVSIRQDGTCTFTGYYQNRGDVWWGTAPAQGFIVSFLVYDTAGKVYAFTYSGTVPSAPQQGSLVTWNITRKCPVIAENWYAIAARNWGGTYWYNTWSESIWSVLGSWISGLASDLGTVAEDVIEALAAGDGDGSDDGDDDTTEDYIKKTSLVAVTITPPAGTSPSGHAISKPAAGTGK